jgi:predicted dehydrogenase
VPTVAGRYEALYEGIRDSLLTGVAPPVALEEAIAVLRVIEAARDSAREGTVVAL